MHLHHQVLQQLSGINAIMFYSTDIFLSTGMKSGEAATILVALVNVLASLLSVRLIEVAGRKGSFIRERVDSGEYDTRCCTTLATADKLPQSDMKMRPCSTAGLLRVGFLAMAAFHIIFGLALLNHGDVCQNIEANSQQRAFIQLARKQYAVGTWLTVLGSSS